MIVDDRRIRSRNPAYPLRKLLSLPPSLQRRPQCFQPITASFFALFSTLSFVINMFQPLFANGGYGGEHPCKTPRRLTPRPRPHDLTVSGIFNAKYELLCTFCNAGPLFSSL